MQKKKKKKPNHRRFRRCLCVTFMYDDTKTVSDLRRQLLMLDRCPMITSAVKQATGPPNLLTDACITSFV